MEITLNKEQRLFVIPSGDGYSCLGFDVVFNHCRELARRIKKFKLLKPGTELAPVLESEIGSPEQYQQYRDFVAMIGDRKIGTWFDYDTPTKVRQILDQYREEGGHLRLFYGDRNTGRDWMEENDVLCRIGRSTGRLPIPLLIANDEPFGPGVLDNCIVRVIDADTRAELYRHKLYHLPEMEIRSTEGQMAHWHDTKPPKPLSEMGYTHGVWTKGKEGLFTNHANFRSYGKAAQWVALWPANVLNNRNNQSSQRGVALFPIWDVCGSYVE